MLNPKEPTRPQSETNNPMRFMILLRSRIFRFVPFGFWLDASSFVVFLHRNIIGSPYPPAPARSAESPTNNGCALTLPRLVQLIDESALVQLPEETHIDKVLRLGSLCLGVRLRQRL